VAIFVSGGIYRDEFVLTRPSGKDEAPYVTSNPTGSLWTSIQGSAHMYRVESDGWLYLEKESWDAESQGIGAPKTYKLLPDELAEIKKSFKERDLK